MNCSSCVIVVVILRKIVQIPRIVNSCGSPAALLRLFAGVPDGRDDEKGTPGPDIPSGAFRRELFISFILRFFRR